MFRFLAILTVFKYPKRQLFYSSPPPHPANVVIETVVIAYHASFQVFSKDPRKQNSLSLFQQGGELSAETLGLARVLNFCCSIYKAEMVSKTMHFGAGEMSQWVKVLATQT